MASRKPWNPDGVPHELGHSWRLKIRFSPLAKFLWPCLLWTFLVIVLFVQVPEFYVDYAYSQRSDHKKLILLYYQAALIPFYLYTILKFSWRKFGHEFREIFWPVLVSSFCIKLIVKFTGVFVVSEAFWQNYTNVPFRKFVLTSIVIVGTPLILWWVFKYLESPRHSKINFPFTIEVFAAGILSGLILGCFVPEGWNWELITEGKFLWFLFN